MVVGGVEAGGLSIKGDELCMGELLFELPQLRIVVDPYRVGPFNVPKHVHL
jgi:hypothetical protein